MSGNRKKEALRAPRMVPGTRQSSIDICHMKGSVIDEMLCSCDKDVGDVCVWLRWKMSTLLWQSKSQNSM